MDPVKQKMPCSFGTARQFYNNRFRKMQELQLHVEVALQQTLKAAAMTSLILCHLVDGIVDRIQVQGLCFLAGPSCRSMRRTQPQHASSGSSWCCRSRLRPAARRNGMHGQPPRRHSACKPQRSRGSLALCHTGHGQVHADLAALTLKVCAQTVNDLLRHTLSLADADHMLGHIGVAGLFDKCGCRSLADRALLRDRASAI